MTRAVKQKKPIGGPFLAVAAFCDNVMQDTDGTMSAIRIVDKITVNIPAAAPATIPSESTKVPVVVWLLLMFKSGSAKGKRELALNVVSPSGKTGNVLKQQVVLSPEPSGGINVKIHFSLGISEGGLFLVDVLMDGKLMTRMPLLVTVAREKAEAAAPPAALKPAKSKRKGS